MVLNKNLVYWNESLSHKENLFDKYYLSNELISESLLEKIRELRELIISYCKKNQNPNNTFDKILNILNTTENIQYSEFVAYWKSQDMTFSIFKKVDSSYKKDILFYLLGKYCEDRLNLEIDKISSPIIIQALYDNSHSRRLNSMINNKLSEMIINNIKNIHQSESLDDFKNINITFILYNKENREFFKQVLQHLRNEFSITISNKYPNAILKINEHIFIIKAKHLKELGGTQNASINKLIDYISIQINNPNIHYVSFLDGRYFNMLIHRKNSNVPRITSNRINELKTKILETLQAYPNNFFVNTGGFELLLKHMC